MLTVDTLSILYRDPGGDRASSCVALTVSPAPLLLRPLVWRSGTTLAGITPPCERLDAGEPAGLSRPSEFVLPATVGKR